jgi:hypothetical protein
MNARTPLTLLAVLAALALPACGDDNEDGSNGGESLSAEEYDAEMEAALQTFAELDELSAPLANPESVDQYVTGVREIVTRIDGTVTDLEAIAPPENVATMHDELIVAVEAYRDVFPPVADAAEAGDKAALQTGAADLQAAALEFQETVTNLDQRFQDEGIDLQSLAG